MSKRKPIAEHNFTINASKAEFVGYLMSKIKPMLPEMAEKMGYSVSVVERQQLDGSTTVAVVQTSDPSNVLMQFNATPIPRGRN